LLTVTLGKAKVGDTSIVGVKVPVGSGVAVRVGVLVAAGVTVDSSVVVGTGAVGVTCSPVEGTQAATNRKISTMILHALI
jgi:hypothetical protein